QMRSGLVVTFLVYPVEDLAQNVHRCVLSYHRDDVVARRRAAGLPVNLDGGETTAQPAAPVSISVETTSDETAKENRAGAASVSSTPLEQKLEFKSDFWSKPLLRRAVDAQPS